jgi:hypothetical protein
MSSRKVRAAIEEASGQREYVLQRDGEDEGEYEAHSKMLRFVLSEPTVSWSRGK